MKNPTSNITVGLRVLITSCLLIQVSCKDFVEIGEPKSQIISSAVFTTDESAISAVRGIYSAMISNGNFTSGSGSGITNLLSLSSDEMMNYSTNTDRAAFFSNSVLPMNAILTNSIWVEAYKYIYYANSLLEGLNAFNSLTPSVKQQLEGEAKFIRAFCYSYLVNLFGKVPIALTTNYQTNAVLKLSSESIVYKQIIVDLESAKSLLTDDYHFSNGERVRPNKWAATALLARVYLYTGDWVNSEKEASEVIGKDNLFSLTKVLGSTFLKNSSEAIFQLIGTSANANTPEGSFFILTTTPANSAIRKDFADSFQPGDLRRTSWIDSITVGANKYYYAEKYKLRVGTTPLNEYYMVLRLAEQFLIRAEARIHTDKIADGIGDLNTIRKRARANISSSIPTPLPDLSIHLNESEALLALEKERKAELFAEWGHRWFDLKRTGRANQVLSTIKTPGWQPSDILFPIPQTEIEKNPNLKIN